MLSGSEVSAGSVLSGSEVSAGMRGEFYGRAYNLSSISIRSFKNETNVLTENGEEKQKRIR
ncbi:hypothetical protein GCM10023116_02900 [Kistimonas scapharcae]|uniref:Uncharacterized protein n=1 Tax=Kistimonas scapharcae TaxID=1036133 RepID=A0ABP8UVV0_9GAMM